MFCIKNSAGLFFNGYSYGGWKMIEQWSEYQMAIYKSKEEAVEATEHIEDFFAEILPISVEKPEEKKEEIKDKRYLYTSAFDPERQKYVGIDHAFERHGVFYFVCYYTQYGEPFVLEEEKLIKFCL